MIKAAKQHFILLLLTVFTCSSIALAAGAQQDAASAVERKKLTVSIYQPTKGLRQDLYALDQEGLLDRNAKWHPFFASDVFVYLLYDEHELATLSPSIYKFLKEKDPDLANNLKRFEMKDEFGRKKILIIIYTKTFRAIDGLAAHRCQIARLVYWGIASGVISDLKEHIDQCSQ